jgi:hypothetical protein
MVSPSSDDDEKKSPRSGQSLLTLRSFVLLLAAAGVVVLWMHNPHVGAAVLGGITVLGFLAKMVKLHRYGVRGAALAARRTPFIRGAQEWARLGHDLGTPGLAALSAPPDSLAQQEAGGPFGYRLQNCRSDAYSLLDSQSADRTSV